MCQHWLNRSIMTRIYPARIFPQVDSLSQSPKRSNVTTISGRSCMDTVFGMFDP